MSTKVLEFCKERQEGRVDKKSTNVYFDFTEGWFRNSDLYNLYSINDEIKEHFYVNQINLSYFFHTLTIFIKIIHIFKIETFQQI